MRATFPYNTAPDTDIGDFRQNFGIRAYYSADTINILRTQVSNKCPKCKVTYDT